MYKDSLRQNLNKRSFPLKDQTLFASFERQIILIDYFIKQKTGFETEKQ